MATTKTELLNNGVVVATRTAAPFYSWDWTPSTSGASSLTYKRYEDNVLVFTSGAITGTVDAAGGSGVYIGTGTVDADYQGVLDEAANLSIAAPDAADQTATNQWIKDYKATGGWAKEDVVIRTKGTASEDFKLIDLKRKVKMTTAGGTVTFSNTGVKSLDGGYIKTGYIPSDGINYALNNASYSFVRVTAPVTNKGRIFGSLGDKKVNNFLDDFSGTTYAGVNSDSNASLGSYNPYIGLNSISRVDANNIIVDRATKSTLDNVSTQVFTLSTYEVYLLGNNNSGAFDSPNDSEISLFTIGASKQAEHAAIKTLVE